MEIIKEISIIFTSLYATAISNFFGVLGGIALLYGGWEFFRRAQRYRSKYRELTGYENNSEFVINFSGHPILKSEENWLEGKKILEIHYGNIAESDMLSIETTADALVKEIREKDIRIWHALKGGEPVVFALPGMSILAQFLIVRINALTGKFPIVTYAISKGNQGFVWRKPINLHEYRTNYRRDR